MWLTKGGFSADGKTRLTREYDLKAAFLFNFTQFVEWPPDAFSDATSPFVIGVLGENPFGTSLDEIVADETVHDRPIEVRRCRNVQEAATCQIVFISRSEASRLSDILGHLNGKSILTVGDIDGFSKRGGMIHFEIEQSKLRVKINIGAAKAAKLTISSKLLRQAEIVDAKPGR